MPEARKAADAALRLDDSLSSAHAVRGKIATLYDWNWQNAERHLRRAIALNGSLASAHVAYVDLLVARGKYEEAAGEVSKAQMLDPVSLANSTDLMLDAFDAEKFDVLDVSARKSLEIDPDFSWAHTLLGWVAAHNGNTSDGLAQAERGARTATSSEQLALLGEVQLMATQKRAAQETLEKLLAQRRNRYVCGHAIALLCGAMGRKQEALEWLETAYRERSDCMPILKRDPATAALHMEPRFQRLVRQVDGG
jgi:tetratricopeptide (TPR) repeat protein